MGQTRGQLTLPELLSEVLEEEFADDNLFLSDGELAYNGTGIEHRIGIKRKSPIKEQQVRNAMSSVKKLVERKGYILCTLRKNQVPGGGKSNRVVGWRLSTKTDKPYIIEDIEVTKKIRDNLDNSIDRKLRLAEEKGLIPPKDIKKLRAGNNINEA